MAPATTLEFLVVTNDYPTAIAAAAGLKQANATMMLAPSCEEASGYAGRHKFDGVIVDLNLAGSRDLIMDLRQGVSNREVIVFVCLPKDKDASSVLVPGANYLIHHPVTAERVFSHVAAVKNRMTTERRRFFRYPVDLPVFLTANGVQQRAVMTNLSEGGMALRISRAIGHPRTVDFTFELRHGCVVEGRGAVVWANNDSMIGVQFQTVRAGAWEKLKQWLGKQEPTTKETVAVPASR